MIVRSILTECSRVSNLTIFLVRLSTSTQLQVLVSRREDMIEKAKELQGENKVLRETIAMMQAQILALMNAHPSVQGITYSRLYFQFVLVIDARGEQLPVPIQTITSKKVYSNYSLCPK